MFQITIDCVLLNVRILNAAASDLQISHSYCLCKILNVPQHFQDISFPNVYCQRLYCETREVREAFSNKNNYLSNISCTFFLKNFVFAEALLDAFLKIYRRRIACSYIG